MTFCGEAALWEYDGGVEVRNHDVAQMKKLHSANGHNGEAIVRRSCGPPPNNDCWTKVTQDFLA
jgi:hypothetical protein